MNQNKLPSWEEVNAAIEKAEHDFCESLDANTSIIKEGACVKIITREQNSTSNLGNVVENEVSDVQV